MTTATGFDDPKIAAAVRDIVMRQVAKTLTAERPPPRYAQVKAWDPNARHADVLYPGDSGVTRVRLGAIQPTTVDQVVRIEGLTNDRYIADVIGASVVTDVPASTLGAIVLPVPTTSPRTLVFDWPPVSGATSYELQVAETNAFAVATTKTYFLSTPGSAITVTALPAGAVRHGRVRARNSGGNGGWSNVVSQTVAADPPSLTNTDVNNLIDNKLSDKVAPTSSPAATVRGLLNRLEVTWPSIANADPVTYEIFMSQTSGFTTYDATTKIGETSGNHFVIDKNPAGAALAVNAAWYVRVRARDRDGAASTAGTQGYGTVAGVSDGSAPGSSPNTPTVEAGLGLFDIRWTAVTNADPVTYEVHIGTVSGFSPSSTTLAGETTNTSLVATRTASAVLQQDVDYFIRIVAKDRDNSAAMGQQTGPKRLKKVVLGDVGNIPSSGISDKAAPTATAPSPTVTAAVGMLAVRWPHISNPDQVTYEVHISSAGAGFVPDANTLVGETTSNFVFIRNVGPGAGGGPLIYTTVYHVKIWPKDQDGYGPIPSTQSGSAAPVRVAGADLAANAIVAGSGIIANLAVDTAQLADLAVSRAKIALLAVDSAQINDLAVSTAKIAELAVTNARIANGTIEHAKINTVKANSIITSELTAATVTLSTNGILRAGTVANNSYRVEFSQTGIRMIYRNASGVDSNTVDLSTAGNAVFSGIISGARIIGTSVNVGAMYFRSSTAEGSGWQTGITPFGGSASAPDSLEFTSNAVYFNVPGGNGRSNVFGQFIRSDTNFGYTIMGAKTTDRTHFETDRGFFDFNKMIYAAGDIHSLGNLKSYSGIGSIGTASAISWTKTNANYVYDTSAIQIYTQSGAPNHLSFHQTGYSVSFGMEPGMERACVRNWNGTAYASFRVGEMNVTNLHTNGDRVFINSGPSNFHMHIGSTNSASTHFFTNAGDIYMDKNINIAGYYYSHGAYVGSQRSLKREITTMEDGLALRAVKKVKPSKYKMRPEVIGGNNFTTDRMGNKVPSITSPEVALMLAEDIEREHYGFLTEDLKEFGLVHLRDSVGYEVYDQVGVMALLWQGTGELAHKMEALEKEVIALRALVGSR